MAEVKGNPWEGVALLKGGSATVSCSGLLPGGFHVFPAEDTPPSSSLWPPAGTGSRKGGAIVAELRQLPVATPREKGSTD